MYTVCTRAAEWETQNQKRQGRAEKLLPSICINSKYSINYAVRLQDFIGDFFFAGTVLIDN